MADEENPYLEAPAIDDTKCCFPGCEKKHTHANWKEWRQELIGGVWQDICEEHLLEYQRNGKSFTPPEPAGRTPAEVTPASGMADAGDSGPLRTCDWCEQQLPRDTHFYAAADKWGGYDTVCKVCRCARKRALRAEKRTEKLRVREAFPTEEALRKEAAREASKRYYRRNRHEILAKKRGKRQREQTLNTGADTDWLS